MHQASLARRYRSASALWLGILSLVLLLCFPEVIADGVREGMSLAYRSVIPAVFPSMILSEALLHADLTLLDRTLGRALSTLFGVSEIGARAVLLGLLSGFPIGAKVTAELYREARISKEEAERLLLLSSSPSPGFLVGAIGSEMLGSRSLGIRLCLIHLASLATVGCLLRGRRHKHERSPLSPLPSVSFGFSFSRSVEGAALGCIRVTACVSFFSMVSALVRNAVSNLILTSFFSAVLELGSGAHAAVSAGGGLSPLFLGFSVGFSGLSVYLQSRSYGCEAGLSMRAYIVGKIFVGILCGVLCLLFLS